MSTKDFLLRDKAEKIWNKIIGTALSDEDGIRYVWGKLKEVFLNGVDYGTSLEKRNAIFLSNKKAKKRRDDLSEIVDVINQDIREHLEKTRYKK